MNCNLPNGSVPAEGPAQGMHSSRRSPPEPAEVEGTLARTAATRRTEKAAAPFWPV